MLSTINQQVEILFGGRQLIGAVTITNGAWGFYCTDAYFLSLFPAGAVYSFNDYSPEVFHMQLQFQRHVIKAINGLIERD